MLGAQIQIHVNLLRFEGESFDRAMIVRGSLERLSPVLMTALVTAFALPPLLFEAKRPGTELLHPIAVVIFGGLISATPLDPLVFWRYGKAAALRVGRRRSSPTVGSSATAAAEQ